jgi:hypothetical protein
LSQSPKRPGARDISELKARLGLKKSGAQSRPAAGVVPPPGARVGAIPAPPGAAPPTPQIPDAAEDPFGAMNAMAAHAQVAAQPQIVIVNDGKPVESVEAKSNLLKYGKIAGIALLPLVLGIIIGKISASANVYNRTIVDSGRIVEDLRLISRSLVEFQQTLQVARERGPGGNAFLVNDTKLTEELDALELVQPNLQVVYHSFLYELPPEIVGDVLSFYNETTLLFEALKDHVDKSKADQKIIQDGQVKLKKVQETHQQYRYAGLIDLPKASDDDDSPQIATFRFVQLGAPICPGETRMSEEGCPPGAMPRGHGFRVSELGSWGTKGVTEVNGEFVKADSLIYLNPGTPVFEQMVKGGEPSVAEVAYMRRITELEEKLNNLIERRTVIEQRLNIKAQESKRFTFFL